MTDQSYDDEEIEYISKSQLKRDANALQDMGMALSELTPAELATVPMPDNLADAIAQYKKLPTREAKRRQMQFIGKIMRSIDSEPIKTALTAIENRAAQENNRFKRLEQWRDRLINEGDPAIGDIMSQYPHADRQHLRQLARQAKLQRDQNAAPAAARQLFKYLRQIDENKLDD